MTALIEKLTHRYEKTNAAALKAEINPLTEAPKALFERREFVEG
jgi:hypothetical protein